MTLDGRIPPGEPRMNENTNPGSGHGVGPPGPDATAGPSASQAPDDVTVEAQPRGRRRGLSALDLYLRAPIGFLWLFVLAFVALPVMLYMTLLYYAAQAFTLLFDGRRARSPSRTNEEERVA